MFAQVTLNYDQLLNQLRNDLASTFTNSVNLTSTNSVGVLGVFPASWGSWPTYALLIFAGLVILSLVSQSFFTVETQSAYIIERFGKYLRTAHAGLQFKVPVVDLIRHRVGLRIFQHEVKVETITKDKVSVIIKVAVQYSVVAGKEADSYYKLNQPTTQIESFVFDLVRAQVPKLTLDEVFDSKDTIAVAVKNDLAKDMDGFGYAISNALVTDVDPDGAVKTAMNAINAAQRQQEASKAQGEAEKIMQVKKAEADAESDKLRGKGIADQRIEIARGIEQSLKEVSEAMPGSDPSQVMNTLVLIQYMETLEKVSANSNTNTIMLPHSPGGLGELREQIMQAFLGARAASTHVNLK